MTFSRERARFTVARGCAWGCGTWKGRAATAVSLSPSLRDFCHHCAKQKHEKVQKDPFLAEITLPRQKMPWSCAESLSLHPRTTHLGGVPDFGGAIFALEAWPRKVCMNPPGLKPGKGLCWELCPPLQHLKLLWGPQGQGVRQFWVPSSSKPPYGDAWPWNLSSIGKTRPGPIPRPPPWARGVLLQLPFLHVEGGRSRVFTQLGACRNSILLKTGP